MNKNFKKKETKSFAITLQKETVERIRHVKKIADLKGDSAYKSLDNHIFKWLIEQEKTYDIGRTDYKTTLFCPKCKHNLKIVSASSGNFLGCSDFPKCKYTQSLK